LGTQIDTIGGTNSDNNSGLNGYVFVLRVQASKSGTLTSVGVNIFSHAGNVSTAIYSDLAGVPHTLLGSGSSTAAINGWNDIPIGGSVSIVSGDYYWIGFQCSSNACTFYYNPNVTTYLANGQSYITWPNPAIPTLGMTSSAAFNLRMTYTTAAATGPVSGFL
jgi:hypothetical protein